jgi:uncharacterized protein (TIGR00369 family)
VRQGYLWDVMEGRRSPPPEESQGTIRVRFTARPEFANPLGVVQGGFLAATLDDTLGPALQSTLAPDPFAPTLELKVNFISPARPGALIPEGRVASRGGSVALLAGELRSEDGALVATATATARIVVPRSGFAAGSE